MGKMKDTEGFLSEFKTGYLECILWTCEDYQKEIAEENGDPWDPDVWDADNLNVGSLAEVMGDLTDFILANHADLKEYESKGRGTAYAGHDFALSRNRHGTGFWDRGMGDLGDRLHEAAKVYGEQGLYVGNDNRLYVE